MRDEKWETSGLSLPLYGIFPLKDHRSEVLAYVRKYICFALLTVLDYYSLKV